MVQFEVTVNLLDYHMRISLNRKLLGLYYTVQKVGSFHEEFHFAYVQIFQLLRSPLKMML